MNRPAAKRAPGDRRRQHRGRWLWIWLGLTGVGMVSAMAGAILAVSLSATPLRQVFLSAEEDAIFNQDGAISWQNMRFPQLTRPVNILVLGTKVLTSDIEGAADPNLGYHALVNSFEGLSDTMLLLRFDPATEALTVLSIPRDTRTVVEGYGEIKINAANYHGGPALSARAVSDLLNGMPIDRYVRVNVQAVEKLIDALGGVEVHVPKDMKYTDYSQHLYIDLKAGQQRLDGEKSMQFLRFRYDQYGDIGRIQRQQTLMRAIVEQTLKPQTLGRIQDFMRRIVPGLDRVEHESFGPAETLVFAQSVRGVRQPWRFYAASVSDGTLRSLGVLTALFQTHPR
ncbi:MAG: LCP family protein, partial [Spirulinaceae cyanobacterium RM2_2_10]|nr:LCP family protein [Spirulinaceae cyanobacterium RM2_2_10]